MTTITTDMSSFTVAQFVIMGIFALLAVAGILFGMRLKRRRLSAQEDTEERREAAGVPDAEAQGGDDTPVAAVARESVAPVAPAPSLDDDAVPVDRVAVETNANVETPQPNDTPTPAAAPMGHDIRQLKGLGPKLAATLAELGITQVDQIAAMSPAELDALDAKLGTFRGRPARDRWAEQARLLSAGDKAGYEAEFGKLGG